MSVDLVGAPAGASTAVDQPTPRAIPLRPRAPRLERHALLRRYLAGADVVAATLAILFALRLVRVYRVHWIVLVVAVPLIVFLAKIAGLYDRDELVLRKSTLDEGPAIMRLATAYTLWIWMLAPLLVYGRLSRVQVLCMWGSMIPLLLLARSATRALFNSRTPPERCMVVGDQMVCKRLERKLDEGHGLNAQVALALPFGSPEEEATEMAILAQPDGLEGLVKAYDLQRLIIAPHDSDADHIRELVQTANGVGLNVSMVPRMLEVIGSSVEFDDVNGLTVMGVQRFGLPRSSRLLKRVMDLAGSIAGFIVLSPLFGLIALSIKLDSRGPVFFRQRRVGQDGKAFEMFKFRTMVNGADAMRASLAELNEAKDGLFKIANDPRITRVGKLLRSVSLDELPQLINVMTGEMSLVGPRPLVLYEDEHVGGWYRERLALTPGMTGRWQILGSARIPLSEMVKLDYLYVANWSLWSDVKILLRTVPFIVARRGL